MKGAAGPLLVLEILLIALSIALPPAQVRAEEAGAGHYIPGATSSFIDMLPDRDTSTFVYANAFTYYHGSANGSKELEFGGLLAANARATIYSDSSFFLYQGGGGARLGGFEGMTTGVGPSVSYAYKIGDFDLAGEGKWLPEFDVSNRLSGNTVWFKLGVSWGPKPSSPLEAM